MPAKETEIEIVEDRDTQRRQKRKRKRTKTIRHTRTRNKHLIQTLNNLQNAQSIHIHTNTYSHYYIVCNMCIDNWMFNWRKILFINSNAEMWHVYIWYICAIPRVTEWMKYYRVVVKCLARLLKIKNRRRHIMCAIVNDAFTIDRSLDWIELPGDFRNMFRNSCWRIWNSTFHFSYLPLNQSKMPKCKKNTNSFRITVNYLPLE